MSLARMGQVMLPLKDITRSASFSQDLLSLKVKYTLPGGSVFLDGRGQGWRCAKWQ